MLRLITGSAGTGKTTHLHQEIMQRAKQQKRSIFIVPEQFSWQAENDIFRLLGDENSVYVEVYSFSTLAREIEKTVGGAAIAVLSDAGRNVFIRRALDLLGDELKLYKKHRRNNAFYTMCADAIREIKLAGLSPSQLLKIAQDGGANYKKLSEIALIYGEYEAAIAGKYADEADRVSRAADKITADYFEGKQIFFDGFDGFTVPEYEMLKKCITANEGCTITLTCDALFDETGGYGLFSETQKTAAKLFAMANKLSDLTVEAVAMPQAKRFCAQGLQSLETYLRTSEVTTNREGVFITSYPSAYEEVRAVMAEMHRLAYEEEVPYKNMALICRDMEAYKGHVRRVGALFHIPFFQDTTEAIEYTGPVTLVRAALSIAEKGLYSPDVLRFLKTGLTPFSEEEISALENYVFTWQVQYAADWNAPFVLNPTGFSDTISELEEKELRLAEGVRAKITNLFLRFIKQVQKATGEQLSRELYLLLQAFGIPQHTEEKANELEQNGHTQLAEKLRRTWGLTMELLDEMVRLLQDDTVSAKEFDEFFVLLARTTDIGRAPQNVDEVLFTQADRMRLASPQYVFVVGVGEGQFPSLSNSEGLLTHSDRTLLVEAGIEMKGLYLNKALIEQLTFYKAMSAASKQLYISCSEYKSEQQTLTASILEFQKHSQAAKLVSAPAVQGATQEAALQILSEQYRENSSVTQSFHAALQQTAPKQVEEMEKQAKAEPFSVTDRQTFKQTIGQTLRISPSRVERYFSCPFSYYLQYILRLRPRRKAELSPLESGSFIHYVLENVMRDAGENFAQMTESEIIERTEKSAGLYIEENMQGDVTQTKRFQNLLVKLKRATAQLLLYIAQEQQQSAFHPVAYELEIGAGAGVEPMTLTTQNGEQIQVVGKVDRVDVMEQNGVQYVRVVDYKTGNKEFSLEDVYYGLNTQMLIYLFTIAKNGKQQLANSVPAGVLYIMGDIPPKPAQSKGNENVPAFRTDGIVLQNTEVLVGMEKEKQGIFIPVSYKKDGAVKPSKYLATLEKFGNIEKHIELLLTQMANDLFNGKIEATPVRGKHNPCEYCEYVAVCRHREGYSERELTKVEKPFEEECEV